MKKDSVQYTCQFYDPAVLNLCGLPPFTSSTLSDFTWCNSSCVNLAIRFDDLYSKIVHWQPNLFMVHIGCSGKAFVIELAHLIQPFADGAGI